MVERAIGGTKKVGTPMRHWKLTKIGIELSEGNAMWLGWDLMCIVLLDILPKRYNPGEQRDYRGNLSGLPSSTGEATRWTWNHLWFKKWINYYFELTDVHMYVYKVDGINKVH